MDTIRFSNLVSVCSVSTDKNKNSIYDIRSRARIVYDSIVQEKIYNEKKNHTSVTK